jgi:hypothetical protein
MNLIKNLWLSKMSVFANKIAQNNKYAWYNQVAEGCLINLTVCFKNNICRGTKT